MPPSGCRPSPRTAEDCSFYRGGIFDKANSSTWHEIGNYSLVYETNLNSKFDVIGEFGFDTVSLGDKDSNATGLPALEWQVVGGVGSNVYYNGRFGLNNQASNFTGVNITDRNYQAYMEQSDLSTSHPSFLTTLKTKKLIPSLSWSYTAGAYSRKPGVPHAFVVRINVHLVLGTSLGSLTFGGYDSSQFVPNNVSFDFSPDSARDLVVGLQAITSSTPNGSAVSLLSSPILAFIDSTLPHMYLPSDACEAFAATFDLKWEPDFGLYLINPYTHANMTARNPNVTLTMGNSLNGGPTIDIVMPYSSFNLTAVFPYVPETMQFFPLRPALNYTQYTLGRAFLQDAYIITNYEHGNFSVSQAKYTNGTKASIVPITAAAVTSPTGNVPIAPTAPSTPAPTEASHSGLSQTALAGIVAGSVGAAMLGIIALGLFFLRMRSRRARERSSSVDKSQIQYLFEKQELDGTAFVLPVQDSPPWYDYKDYKEKRAELMDVEFVELPDQPVINEIMSRPRRPPRPPGRPHRPWTPRLRAASDNRKYNAYINVQKAREIRMSNGKISPPISKFCRVSCTPVRDKVVDLNRALPALPVFRSPRTSGTRSPMPKDWRAQRVAKDRWAPK